VHSGGGWKRIKESITFFRVRSPAWWNELLVYVFVPTLCFHSHLTNERVERVILFLVLGRPYAFAL
jgi:hypothetical protein